VALIKDIHQEDKTMNTAKWLHPVNGYQSDAFYKQLYGKDLIVSRLGKITLIHLDHPSKEEIQRRIEETIREELTGEAFSDDCPLCREFREHPHNIVYYGQS
jgi:hypothetical protein